MREREGAVDLNFVTEAERESARSGFPPASFFPSRPRRSRARVFAPVLGGFARFARAFRPFRRLRGFKRPSAETARIFSGGAGVLEFSGAARAFGGWTGLRCVLEVAILNALMRGLFGEGPGVEN